MEVGKVLTNIIRYLDSNASESLNASYSLSGTELNGNKNAMGMEGVEIETSSNDIEHRAPAIERPAFQNAKTEKVTEFEKTGSGNIVYHNTKTERFDKKGRFVGDTFVSKWTTNDKKEENIETTDSDKNGFPLYRSTETRDAETNKITRRVEQSDFYQSSRSGITPARQITTYYDSDGNIRTETVVVDPKKGTATKTVITENSDGTKTTRVYSREGGKDVSFFNINKLNKETIHDSNGNLISEKNYPNQSSLG